MVRYFLSFITMLMLSVGLCKADINDPLMDGVIIEQEKDGTVVLPGNPKVPSYPILLNLCESQISWNEYISFEEIQLLDIYSETEAYSGIIGLTANSITLPSYLHGTYIIRLFNGNVWYRGIVTL